MKPHFASTIHAARQMDPRAIRPSALTASSRPAVASPKHTPRRLDRPADHGVRHVMVLPEGESLTIVTSDGRPLLEIASGENGPEIRLAQDDLRIECPGQLDLAAKAITMSASGDVTVRGQTIRLN